MIMGDGKDLRDQLEDPVTVQNVFSDSFSSSEVNAPRTGSLKPFFARLLHSLVEFLVHSQLICITQC